MTGEEEKTKVGDNDATTEKDKPLNERTWDSEEQFSAELDTNTELRNAYLEDGESFEKRIKGPDGKPLVDPSQGDSSQGDSTGEGEKTPQVSDSPEKSTKQPSQPEDITVSITDEMLGTYGTGRSKADGVVAALEGNVQKDTFIGTLREQTQTDSNTITTLRAQLAEAKAKKAEVTPPPPPVEEETEVSPIDMSEIDALVSEDAEHPLFVNQEGGKKVVGLFKQLAERNQDLSKKVDTIGKTAKKKLTDDDTIKEEDRRKGIISKRIADDCVQIDAMATDPRFPELKLSKPFAQVDKDVLKFQYDIGTATKTLRDGKRTTVTLDFVKQYLHDATPAGDEFRKKCTEAGVKPPADLKKHTVFMQVRGIRKRDQNKMKETFAEASGRPVTEIGDWELPELTQSFADYFTLEKANNGDFQAQLLRAKVDGHKQATKPVGGDNTADEIPAEIAGGTNMTLESMNVQQMSSLLDKVNERDTRDKMTADEVRVLCEYLLSEGIPIQPHIAGRAEALGLKLPT